jgi:hypothetical protein
MRERQRDGTPVRASSFPLGLPGPRSIARAAGAPAHSRAVSVRRRRCSTVAWNANFHDNQRNISISMTTKKYFNFLGNKYISISMAKKKLFRFPWQQKYFNFHGKKIFQLPWQQKKFEFP